MPLESWCLGDRDREDLCGSLSRQPNLITESQVSERSYQKRRWVEPEKWKLRLCVLSHTHACTHKSEWAHWQTPPSDFSKNLREEIGRHHLEPGHSRHVLSWPVKRPKSFCGTRKSRFCHFVKVESQDIGSLLMPVPGTAPPTLASHLDHTSLMWLTATQVSCKSTWEACISSTHGLLDASRYLAHSSSKASRMELLCEKLLSEGLCKTWD